MRKQYMLLFQSAELLLHHYIQHSKHLKSEIILVSIQTRKGVLSLNPLPYHLPFIMGEEVPFELELIG